MAAPQGESLPPSDLKVATKVAPPFAVKLEDGTWSGLSVDLWNRVATQLHWHADFVEVESVQEQVNGVAAGVYEAAIAAITVTADRERRVDFTTPYYSTGLGIAVPINAGPTWRPVINALTSFGFLQAVLALIVISLSVGVLIWLFERRHNEDFGGGVAKGLFSSMWWSTIAATQASTGDFGPRTVPGRTLAVVWMMASIIALAVFTAGVTSVLTVKQLEGLVQSENDLKSARVGIVANSSSADYLNAMRVDHRDFADVQHGLDALRAGTIDAFVYDKPLLSWTIRKNYTASLQVLDATFDEQGYAVALLSGSSLREPLNIALLRAIESDWWRQAVFQYLGSR
jgi:polar amino acid transport system substrate-binding protein